MAVGTIKGITIEIEGKTSGLVKSLGNVNKSLSETQKSLKTVNDALKLDPKNVDTLRTKQELLTQAIKETEEKLKLEKQAAADAAKALEDGTITKNQYDTLQAEVAKTTSELNKLEKESQDTNKQLNELGGSTKLASLEKSLDTVKTKLSNIGDKCIEVGKSLSMKVTLPIAAAATASIKTAAEFESSMAKVQAVSGATGSDLESLETKAREMGESTVFSASEAAEAMNYMAMAGWKTEDMLSGIEGIMNLAAASGEDLATTSDIVTDALTAFGMSASESGKLADILAAASSNANTNVSMMGESFKYVAPVAGAMGYSAEDVSVALGLMANSGIKASQAGTALRSILSRMAKPTDEIEGAMEALGVSLTDNNGNMKSLREIMQDIRKGMGNLKMSTEEITRQMELLDTQLENGEITEKQYDEALEDLTKNAFGAEGALKAEAAAALGGKNALSGLLAIANSSDADFQKLTDAIDNSNGSAQKMADIMNDTAEGKLKMMKSKLEELGIQIGEKLIPILEKVVDWISGLIDWFSGLDEGTQNFIITVGLLAAALGPILTIGGTLVKGISGIIGLISKVSTAINGAGGLSSVLSGLSAGPLAAVILSITAIVTCIENWEAISEVLEFAWEKTCEALQEVFQTLSNVWNDVVNGIEAGIERIFGDINAARDQALALEREKQSAYAGQIAQNRANYEKYGSAYGAAKSESYAGSNSQAAIQLERQAAANAARSSQNAKASANHNVAIYMGSANVENVVSNANGTTNARSGGR